MSNNLYAENDIKLRKCRIPRATILNLIVCASLLKEKQ
jgi:hypothetical protein